jgi:hypothetical protein
MIAAFNAVEPSGKIAIYVLQRRTSERRYFRRATLSEFIHLTGIAARRTTVIASTPSKEIHFEDCPWRQTKMLLRSTHGAAKSQRVQLQIENNVAGMKC